MHPLSQFIHCPRCGGPFREHDARSKRCAQCGFTYYHNSSAAVAAFILDEDGDGMVIEIIAPDSATLEKIDANFIALQ